MELSDGQWEVVCPDCLRNKDETMPLGIGVPIANRREAEQIAHNHATGRG
jgi:hypothetical protein